MKRCSLLVVLAACCFAFGLILAPAAAAPPGPNLDPVRIRAIVEAESRKAGVQGLVFGIWQGDRPILVTARGRSMATVPATPSMHYRIGGITETFMSTLLMILAERKRVDLDATISKWYPKLLGAEQVTMRMLVANRAGYVDYVRLPEFQKEAVSQPFRTWKPDELIAYAVKGNRMAYEPGTSQAYSHTEYIILGQVMQKATGQSLKSLYEQYIFRPLRLNDTQSPTDQEIQAPVLHSFSSDREVYEDATYYNPSWAGATGALTSNVLDLGRWGPIFGTGRLLSRASFKQMIAPAAAHLGKNAPDRYFAYGFAVMNGWLAQDPNMNGYSGGFAYNMRHRITIVVEATRNEKAASEAPGKDILNAVTRYVTPDGPTRF